MNAGKIGFALAVLTLSTIISAQAFSKTDDDLDYAVPAFSDLSVFTPQASGAQTALGINPAYEELNALPLVQPMKWLDINHDDSLNEFDVKQFQAIIESLNGEKLSGLDLATRFRNAQKNQNESFPILYDLDRDGMFTANDVDSFSEAINQVDEGATKGSELTERFRLRVFPVNKK